jgi:hypothetical protein
MHDPGFFPHSKRKICILYSFFGILIDDWNNSFFKDQNRLLNYKSKDKYRCSSQKHLLTSSNPTILWLHKILRQAKTWMYMLRLLQKMQFLSLFCRWFTSKLWVWWLHMLRIEAQAAPSFACALISSFEVWSSVLWAQKEKSQLLGVPYDFYHSCG